MTDIEFRKITLIEMRLITMTDSFLSQQGNPKFREIHLSIALVY